MGGPPIRGDDERELRELRARAYGRNADIFDDPEGLARLAELENRRAANAVAARIEGESAGRIETEVESSTHAESASDRSHFERWSAGPSTHPVPSADPVPSAGPVPSAIGAPSAASGWRRMTSRRSRPIWLGVGAGLAVVAISWGMAWVGEPHPTATLASTANRGDEEVLALTAEPVEWYDIDTTTLRSYEAYRGVEPWSARDAFGNPCLILIDRSADEPLEAACTPADAQLIVDIAVWRAPVSDFAYAEGLADGSVVRFRHRGDSVDVSIINAPGGD
ncbi:hypothetical protein [Agromyces italicus]|uniref:hypothetical protein n=1 Tax=Agromyces italicus TaxID=279572 RepID=UPI0003B68D42|nr:hypothetical protein [Agromyces italicus]